MKRPYISISGTLDELILMEAILAYYYDEPNEGWNNNVMKDDDWDITHLLYYDGRYCQYMNHGGAFNPKQFKASQLTEILTYIEEYERRNS